MSLCPMVACVRRSARREEADSAVEARELAHRTKNRRGVDF